MLTDRMENLAVAGYVEMKNTRKTANTEEKFWKSSVV